MAEFDLRVADVAAVSQAGYEQMDPDDNLHGAPELVIKVKSPSNSDRQLRDLASLALANGCWEFWIIDADPTSVTVVRNDGLIVLFGPSQAIPLTPFTVEELSLDEIFR